MTTVLLRTYRTSQPPSTFLTAFEDDATSLESDLVIDWKRAERLVGETMREIGVLIFVFAPLEYLFAERPPADQCGFLIRFLRHRGILR
jgi:hypothetical protein